jgi:hypothetical protein
MIAGQPPSRAIRKGPSRGVPANMVDYERARAEFSWAAARGELAGLPGGVGYLAVAQQQCRERPQSDP